ncbi:hypothetical protein HF086_000512 [Spodoptera exigua]|uniref:Innexin n=1 Tax=Spodoptera exigua TaxID=7107 RepID=A0A922MQ51_SPOEX|nr:hypothetical protein HF086_000512 [Spodoptera exigua]
MPLRFYVIFFFEQQGVNPKIDSVAFRLHCGATTAALLAASAALTTRHLVGNPIDCIHTRDIPEDVLNTYCWIHSTFTVAGEAGGAYPGVRSAGQSPRRYGKYYQWVAFTLFFQVSGLFIIVLFIKDLWIVVIGLRIILNRSWKWNYF